MPTTTLILVRHAESEHNVKYPKDVDKEEVQDPRITETGHAQARIIAQLLDERFGNKVTKVFVSPMLRTLQTARYFCNCFPSLEVNITATLFEKTGLRCQRDVIDSIKPSEILKTSHRCIDHEPGNRYRKEMATETEDDVRQRGSKFLDEFVKGQETDETIVCFTHSLMMSELTKVCTGSTNCKTFHNSNCSLTILRSEDQGKTFEVLCQNYNPLPVGLQTGLQF